MLINPCETCAKKKVACDRMMACSSAVCTHCEPSQKEWVTRAKKVFKELRDGDYYHNDFARYQIYLQSLVFDTKIVLTRQDVLDIFRRISAGDVHYSFIKPLENRTIDDLPVYMKTFAGSGDVTKLEFLDKGRYKVVVSPKYESYFMTGDEIIRTAKYHRIPPKLVDTCRFNQYDLAYRVWSESLYRPGCVISYTGPALWRADNVCVWTTMRVLSYIQAHDSVATITQLSR